MSQPEPTADAPVAHGTRPLQVIVRVLLGAFLLFAGTAHLTFARAEFAAQVPDFVPLSDDFVIVASGIVELALGTALIVGSRWRYSIGWIVAAFFVVIFPGNIAQWADGRDAFGLDTDTGRLIRLFFQPVLIAIALWSTGAWQAWRASRSHR